MDKITSTPDKETEREIVNEIQRLNKQKTMTVISHCMNNVDLCPRIDHLKPLRIVNGTAEKVERKKRTFSS